MTDNNVLTAAVVGSGPAGFYTADALFKATGGAVRVDMYDRLPTPFGLVRFGVAPDHLKIKNVTKTFEKIAARDGFRFFGNVDVGDHVTVEELRHHYDAVFVCTGAQSDRKMGIPGEDLAGSHPATDFVAWYNGHPDYRHLEFNLDAERVAVVGLGNVAVDVARILCRTPEELRASDIADYALEALSNSKVKEVYMLGRRGPAQAAYTNPEAKELGEMAGASVSVLPAEVELDPESRKAVDESGDAKLARKVEITRGFADSPRGDKPRNLTIRFLVSPVELLEADGRVSGMRLVRNRLEPSGNRLRAVASDEYENLPVELVFRSVGYFGVEVPGLPLDESRGVIPNEAGRVIDPATGGPVGGVYVSGWIKRGPSGVIGTNKPDAVETVETMMADRRADRAHGAEAPVSELVERIETRQPHVVSYADWKRLDELEIERGKQKGRPRCKIVSREDVLEAISN